MAKRGIRSPIPWFGDKARLARKICGPDSCRSRLVCRNRSGGAANVLLSKPPSKLEVYNDINEGLFSLFTVLKDAQYYSKFYGQPGPSQPYSRDEFGKALERWKCSTDVVERALAFYSLARQSFGATCKSWGYDKKPGKTGQGSKQVQSLLNAQKRTSPDSRAHPNRDDREQRLVQGGRCLRRPGNRVLHGPALCARNPQKWFLSPRNDPGGP